MVVCFGLLQLTDHNIGNSRNTSFEQLIMSETNGRGVDLVLNSLSEKKLQASVRCLALGGRYLEIGRFDLNKNRRLGRLFLINLFHFCWYNVMWFCLELQQDKMLLVFWLYLYQYSDYTVSWVIEVWFPGKGKKFFSFLKHPDSFWDPPSLLFNS